MSYDLSCSACGTKFRTVIAEARHRHNFPALCKRNARFRRFEREISDKRTETERDDHVERSEN